MRTEFGTESFSPATTRVLVVGAGGIGCELLKNLVLSGYLDIEVVDLDTIELSNLNRQFLFRRRHIGQYKAQVAAEAVCAMNPDAKVVAHVGNIMDVARFPLAFFQKFKIVLNALDNIAARRYVNNMCQAVGLPLVENGTAGYLGQCTVHLPRKTECYECTAKQAPKTFAVCTIRSTPSAPIHCVVWAKDYLLSNIFGAATEDEISSEIEDSAHIASLKKETEALKRLRELAAQQSEELGKEVFNKVFHDDIEAIRSIATLWESRPAPTSLSLKGLEIPSSDALSVLDDQKVWTVEQWIALLFDSLNRLAKRLPGVISFDKDDQDTLDFVTSVANLRAHVYGIPMTSRFALKALAGNIIPAIATTNAIAAGMIVIQAENILSGHEENLADVFITFDVSRPQFFLRSKLVAPNPECSVCFVHRAILQCNTGHFKLGQIIDEVVPMFLKKLNNPEVTTECLSILEGSRMIYDEEDMPQSREKTLADLGATDTKFLRFEFLEGLPLVIAVQQDDSYGATEFGCTFDLLAAEQVKLGTKRPLSDEDSGSDLEVIGEPEDESDLEIIEPPTTRIKISEE